MNVLVKSVILFHVLLLVCMDRCICLCKCIYNLGIPQKENGINSKLSVYHTYVCVYVRVCAIVCVAIYSI